MTEQQFHEIRPGDMVRYRGRLQRVTSVSDFKIWVDTENSTQISNCRVIEKAYDDHRCQVTGEEAGLCACSRCLADLRELGHPEGRG